jgi:imidazolonepropionase-like amidohydrolase
MQRAQHRGRSPRLQCSHSAREHRDMSNEVLFTRALLFEGESPQLREADVRVLDGNIVEVSEQPLATHTGRLIELNGRTLMPGLIDAHVHVCCTDVDERRTDLMPPSLVAQRARIALESSLQRGFTSVRDTGGADRGLHLAVECGWIKGPRLFFCGKVLSQTGGHGDLRAPYDAALCSCGTGYRGHLAVVVDGVEALIREIREQLRGGASFVKILASGGVASPNPNLRACQYSEAEIRAAVDEAERHGVYVTAHAHSDTAVRRCIALGVHGIEHATLITDDTARLAAKAGTAIVPTLAVIDALRELGPRLGFPAGSLAKLESLGNSGLESLEVLHRAGARVGFGTDLIGQTYDLQCTEFTIRSAVLTPFDILRSATSVNAAILGQADRLGRVAPGFLADLIVVEGNPLQDVGLFTADGRHVPLVMKGGEILKDSLGR